MISIDTFGPLRLFADGYFSLFDGPRVSFAGAASVAMPDIAPFSGSSVVTALVQLVGTVATRRKFRKLLSFAGNIFLLFLWLF
jgi:hypothetical protein